MDQQQFDHSKNIDHSKKALNDLYNERFLMLMKLIRIDKMLRSAKIIHVKPEEK